MRSQKHESSGTQLEIWRVPLARVDDPRRVLSEDEIRRADRFVVAKPAWQFERSRAALRMLLGRYLGEDPRRLRFDLGAHGKPMLRGDEMAFNLSHSGDFAVVVLGRRAWGNELGVDVEEISAERRLEALAERFFASTEYAAFVACERTQQPEFFYRLWTLKESYVKAIGTGLTFSSRRFAFEMSSDASVQGSRDRVPRLSYTEWGTGNTESWCFREFSPAAGHQAAVCWPSHNEASLVFRDYTEVMD